MSGSGISWAVCKSAPCCRQTTTPAPHTQYFTDRMPFLSPNQQRQSTEGMNWFEYGCTLHNAIMHGQALVTGIVHVLKVSCLRGKVWRLRLLVGMLQSARCTRVSYLPSWRLAWRCEPRESEEESQFGHRQRSGIHQVRELLMHTPIESVIYFFLLPKLWIKMCIINVCQFFYMLLKFVLCLSQT